MTDITIQTVINDATQGRFFSIRFIKADGTERTMLARTGVKRYLKGGKRTTNPNQVVVAYSINDKAYRSFRIDRLIDLKCGKTHLHFENNEVHANG